MTAIPQRRMGYYEIDGQFLPSVTTVLKVLNKPALINWAAKQGALAVLTDPVKYSTPEAAARAIYEIDDVAMKRGSDAHKVAELYADAIIAGTADSFKSGNPYFKSIKAFFDTMRPEIIYREVRLVNMEQGYAGTADLIAKVGSKTFVIDYKSSKGVFPEHHLQVEAYRQATMIILEDGTRITQHPIADAGAVVLLKADGTFGWVETAGDHIAFLAAMILFTWSESHP